MSTPLGFLLSFLWPPTWGNPFPSLHKALIQGEWDKGPFRGESPATVIIRVAKF